MRCRRTRDEAGLTLIEVLVTVAILGIAFVTVVGGMAVSIAGSDMHRKQATSQTVLRNLAEFLKAADYQCSGDYTAAIDPPTGFTAQVGSPVVRRSPLAAGNPDSAAYTVEITEVRQWTSGTVDPAMFQAPATCEGDNGLQQLRIQVQSVARPDLAPESLLLVKRAP